MMDWGMNFAKGLCLLGGVSLGLLAGCVNGRGEGEPVAGSGPAAEEILGNPEYRAMSYSGWRTTERRVEWCPTVEQIKEDLKILEAMGIRFIRTYNTTIFPQSERILEAIADLQAKDPGFEMYVMLGAWVQREGVYEEGGDPALEDEALNRREVERAMELARQYPEIVKVIAVGNEAMVHWQPHHVEPAVIHKWIRVLREARTAGELPEGIWFTTSDNWAALGGEEAYRGEDLVALLRDLDYISLHTYAFHDSYYYPTFAWAEAAEGKLAVDEQVARAVGRAIEHQAEQVEATRAYMTSNGIDLDIHIGETGWASLDDAQYGNEGTAAASELALWVFHDAIRDWTEARGMSCFYFQAFDEPWKSSSPDGSESHFGLFTVDGQAKVPLWDLVDAGVFDGLERDGQPIRKTHGGERERLVEGLKAPRALKH